MRKVEVIPVVIGALGTVTKHFVKRTNKLDLLDFLSKLILL